MSEEETSEKPEAPNTDSKLAEVLARLNNTISAKLGQPQPVQQAQKTYTRTELNDAVLAGEMTQSAADAVMERQNERRIAAVAQDAVDVRMTAEKVKAEIKRYQELLPATLEDGTPEREKLKNEYLELVSLGQPDSIVTELAALRVAFGKLNVLEAAKKPRRTEEHHQDVGGAETAEGRSKGPLAKLPPRLRSHYEKMIQKGQYTGPDDPDLIEELKYSKAS